jgi:hypothetical protein
VCFRREEEDEEKNSSKIRPWPRREERDEKVRALPFFWPKECWEIEKE